MAHLVLLQPKHGQCGEATHNCGLPLCCCGGRSCCAHLLQLVTSVLLRTVAFPRNQSLHNKSASAHLFLPDPTDTITVSNTATVAVGVVVAVVIVILLIIPAVLVIVLVYIKRRDGSELEGRRHQGGSI